jgi:hypothetical protein
MFYTTKIKMVYIIYKFYHDGILFTGPNDGMEQMVPIQMFLFNQWSQTNFNNIMTNALIIKSIFVEK